jgi:superfamily II DNA/RNA helicase
LSIFSTIDFSRSSVQALVVVPTRELGMQVIGFAGSIAFSLHPVCLISDVVSL